MGHGLYIDLTWVAMSSKSHLHIVVFERQVYKDIYLLFFYCDFVKLYFENTYICLHLIDVFIKSF